MKLNLPNKISLIRIFMIPVFVLVFLLNFTGNYIVAGVIFTLAAANGVVLAAEKLGKYKTVFQDVCIVVLFVSADITSTAGAVVACIGFSFFVIATLLTVISGVSYVVKNKQVLTDA